jgi:hypothetical protein
MKTRISAVVLVVVLARPAGAQDNLTPDTSAFADPDPYLLKCRHVFASYFKRDVPLRVVVLGCFAKEYVVGLQFGGAGAQAFVLDPSSSIWDTE